MSTNAEAYEAHQLLTLPDTVPLTTRDVASVAPVTESTLRKWASWGRDGDLLPYIKRGGKNLYRPSDVRRWLGMEEEA